MLEENFKTSREILDIQAKDVAELLNISRSTMSCYENGHNQFPLEKLIMYANTYEVCLDFLFGISKNLKLENKLIFDKEIIAANLYRLRKDNQVTQIEIADKMGKSQSSYSRYETGKLFPTVELLSTLIQLYPDFSIDRDIFTLKKQELNKN